MVFSTVFNIYSKLLTIFPNKQFSDYHKQTTDILQGKVGETVLPLQNEKSLREYQSIQNICLRRRKTC